MSHVLVEKEPPTNSGFRGNLYILMRTEILPHITRSRDGSPLFQTKEKGKKDTQEK
jgi:hypothetical protein